MTNLLEPNIIESTASLARPRGRVVFSSEPRFRTVRLVRIATHITAFHKDRLCAPFHTSTQQRVTSSWSRR